MLLTHPVIKRTLIVTAILIVTLSCIVASLPLLTRWLAISWLEDNGVQASIEKVRINLFKGTFDISNANGRNTDGEGFELGEFHLDIAMMPLWKRHVVIEDFQIRHFRLDLAQDEKGLTHVAGIMLAHDNNEKKTDAPSKSWQVITGNISLSDIGLCHRQSDMAQHYCAQLSGFDWQGTVQHETGKSTGQPVVRGNLNVSGIVFMDKAQEQVIVSAKSLGIDRILLNGVKNVSLNRLSLNDFVLFPPIKITEEQTAITSLTQFEAGNTVLKENRLTVATVRTNGLSVFLNRDKNGEWNIREQLARFAAPERKADKEAQETAVQESTPFSINIAEIEIETDKPVHISDSSMESEFVLDVIPKTIRLKNIDTADIAAFSQLQLQLVVDKHGTIDISGPIQLMGQQKSFDLKGVVTGVDLRPLSAYMESALGYRVRSGQLNADIALKSQKGQLDSLLALDFRQFQIKPLSNEDAEKMKVKMGFPLNTALNLLREKDNRIALKLPVTGDVNKPEFDPSDAVFKAVSKAVTATIINYYTPFGLVTATKGLINLATALRFEPLEFSDATDVIAESQYEYLGNLLKLLVERPQLYLTLCGTANRADLAVINPDLIPEDDNDKNKIELDEATKEKLLILASKRAENLKTWLVGKGIDAERLILCEPEFSYDGKAAVDVSI